jgi:hypothetical protein
MGSGVTGSAHSRKAAKGACALALALLGLAGCLEPAPYLEVPGSTEGKAKHAHCSPLSCTGCCAGDECLGGNADAACGYDGRACTACPTTHRCESPGACYPLPMADTAPAGPLDPEPYCNDVDGMLHCQ